MPDGRFVFLALVGHDPRNPGQRLDAGVFGQQRPGECLEFLPRDFLRAGEEGRNCLHDIQSFGHRPLNRIDAMAGVRVELHLNQLPFPRQKQTVE